MPEATHSDIRRAAPEDARVIAQVLLDSFVEFKSLYTEAGFSATTPAPGQILTRMREGPVWIASRNNKVLGTVAAIVTGNAVYIRGMAVLPSARGSGTGAALLQYVENWATAQGCERLFLSTTPFLSSAIRLYERSGFTRTDEGPHDLHGTPLFVMEKNIPPQPSR
ncbi:MAG: GNAT family N-acetyltransferase [Candidatus Sulfotelmatobacter sp.]